jgi:hypothetical protein
MEGDTSEWTGTFSSSSSAHGPGPAVITGFVLLIKPGVFSPFGGIGAWWKSPILIFTELIAFIFLHRPPLA